MEVVNSTIPLFKVSMNTDKALPELQKVFESGFIGEGPKVQEFEAALGVVFDTPKDNLPLTVNSCTSALDMALYLSDIQPGDKVLSTPQTCLATSNVIHNRGAEIVWVDIDPLTGNMCPKSLVKIARLTPDAKAVMTVDWAGRCSVTDSLIVAAGGIPIIQDAAHSFDTRYKGRSLIHAGADFICHSYQAIKQLTTGDGGSIWCKNPRDRERGRLYRWYGLDRTTSTAMRCKQEMKMVGVKCHMNDIAATIGLANLQTALDNGLKSRRNALELCRSIVNVKIAVPPFDADCAYWIFSIHVKQDRDTFIPYCKSLGVEASLVHVRNDTQRKLRASSAALDRSTGYYEVAGKGMTGIDKFSETQVAIPCGPWLSALDLNKIIEVVNGF